jgi:endogenous inhibitor of DNA gyrase (YacG/DUF329 family)
MKKLTIDDNFIINNCFGIDGRIKRKLNDDIINYLKNRYDDSLSINETLHRIKYNIHIRPICPVCGKPTKYIGRSSVKIFSNHCSTKCSSLDINVQHKLKQTCLEKYGSENIANTEYYRIKTAKTNLERYNDTHVWGKQSLVRHKCKETSIRIFGKYNYNNKNKSKQTCLEKYGYDCILKHPDIKEKIKNKKDEIKLKEYNTKKKNNSFNKSNLEDDSYILLKEKYPDTVRQYRSDKYPFNCDFYIPSLDLYIECNYHWTHGNKPFEGTEEDNIKLEQWKLKNTKYYNNAIYTWTDLDIRKRNIAKENKLNYKEFFSILKLKQYINTIYGST